LLIPDDPNPAWEATPMSLDTLRFEYERYLFEDLQREPEIQAWQQADRSHQFNLHKRHLLGTAMRINELLFPKLHAIYQDCLRRLGPEARGSLYVYQQSDYNAHVHAHQDSFDMVLTSALVKDFKPAEIAFVIGHELGHVLFRHNSVPASALLFSERANELPANLARRLFQWSRAAEISADRVGFLACGDLCAAANAFFKLASGLQAEDDDRVLRALHLQFEEIARLTGELGGDVLYASTHPLIPIRFKSLELISLDLLALRNSNKPMRPQDMAEINRQVQQVLVRTEPLNLQVRESTAVGGEDFLSLLVLGLLYVALADGPLRKEEQEFVREVVARYQGRMQLDGIFEDCRKRPAEFRAEVLAEVEDCKLPSDEVLQILHTCAVLIGGRRAAPPEIQAMRELCRALNGAAEWVDNLLG
jgi:hypothetical protein